MGTNKLLAPVVLLAALSLTALPAAAGQGRSRENHGDRGRAVAHATPRQAAPRQAAPQQSARRQNESRQGEAPRYAPRHEQNQSRQAQPRANERRGGAPQRYTSRQGEATRYAPRREAGRTYGGPRGNYYRPSYRPYYRPAYQPHYFARPYFSFRPRLTIGFGLWLGYPVPYPYGYVGRYAPGLYGSVGVARGVSIYGGLSFDISPYDAAVFVDGQYVGTVGDFPPNAPPLTLTPGLYRIEVQAPGYRPMVWDVTIVPGQVIPYRGAMQPY